MALDYIALAALMREAYETLYDRYDDDRGVVLDKLVVFLCEKLPERDPGFDKEQFRIAYGMDDTQWRWLTR